MANFENIFNKTLAFIGASFFTCVSIFYDLKDRIILQSPIKIKKEKDTTPMLSINEEEEKTHIKVDDTPLGLRLS